MLMSTPPLPITVLWRICVPDVLTQMPSESLDGKFRVARYKPSKYPPRLRLEIIGGITKKLSIFGSILRLADKILRGEAKTCLLCGIDDHVVRDGSDSTKKSDRIQKFICLTIHEHENVELDVGFKITVAYHRPVRSASRFVYFRATTSLEALVLQALQAVWTLRAIISGATIEFIEQYLGLTKSYVEGVTEPYAQANTVEFAISRDFAGRRNNRDWY